MALVDDDVAVAREVDVFAAVSVWTIATSTPLEPGVVAGDPI